MRAKAIFGIAARVASDQSTHVVYRWQAVDQPHGVLLESSRRGPGRPGIGMEQAGQWTMGLLKPSDWEAQWIGVAPKPTRRRPIPGSARIFRSPAVRFKRRSMSLRSGYHELYVNGRIVNGSYLTPSISDLSKHVRIPYL